MKRVVSLYLPDWSIDRVRRAERRSAPAPEAPRETDTRGAFDAIGADAAGNRAGHCSVPKGGGWRPGARWAKSDPAGGGPADSREDVEAAIEAMPKHRRPPQRELGRISEAADNPFRDPADPAPFVNPPPLVPSVVEAHDPGDVARGMSFDFALDERVERVGNRHNDEVRHASIRRAAMLTPVQGPGEDVVTRRAIKEHKRSARDGHDGEAGHIAPADSRSPFFQTGRTLGSVVARVCRDGDEHSALIPSNEPPLVLTHRIGTRIEVSAANRTAHALGIAPGTALTMARAQVPGLIVRAADPDGDAADLRALAELLARRWAPVVAISDADGLFVDLTGVAHLYGDEKRFVFRLLRLLARHGVGARAAIADTAGAAWAMARYNHRVRATFVDCGDHPAAVALLPVAALRLDRRPLELLARLGVDTVGQLLEMPRAPLVRRFGRAIVARLDQAVGRVPEPLDPVSSPTRIAVEQRFAEPIATPEAIEHWLRDLTARLCVDLARAGQGARAVELVAARVDGVPQRLRLGFARATRDPVHMLRLALRRIEEIEPGYGLDALALHVRRADPLGPTSLAPALAEDAEPDLALLVDALANRIGSCRLWRAAALESDVPERSVSSASPLEPPPGRTTRLKADDVRHLDGRTPDHPWHPRWPRPVRLLRRPEEVDHVVAMLPDQPPRRFTWRGAVHRVVHAEGPERIAGEWWRRTGERLAVRDYYRVEDEAGARYWLYRRGDGVRAETGDLRWFLQAKWF